METRLSPELERIAARSDRATLVRARLLLVGFSHHGTSKYLPVPWCGQVLARGAVLIKYLLLVPTYSETLLGGPNIKRASAQH
jgi:hypothetical protein